MNMFGKIDLGTVKLAETNEGVHSDQNEKGQSINLKFKTMKKTIQFSFMMVFVMTTIFFAGCKKEQVSQTPTNFNVEETDISKVDEKIKQDAIAYYGKVVTMSDFPSETLLDISYMERINQSIKTTDVGGSPENALVSLIFDQNGVLYTAKRYDQEIYLPMLDDIKNNGDQSTITKNIKEVYTDLKTFYKITRLKEATSEYADVIGNIWSFDPYVRFFEKKSERDQQVKGKYNSLPKAEDSELKALSTVPEWGKIGNVLYARWDGILSVSNYTGHTGGITTEISATYTTNIAKMYNTYTTEAVSSSAGTLTRRMTNSSGTGVWNASSIYNRSSLWLSSLTSTQRSNIASYQVAQAGEPYEFNFTSTELNRTDRWYCSKLQWRAYLDKTGINIDKNGGSVVYPDDIYTNSNMIGMSFGLA